MPNFRIKTQTKNKIVKCYLVVRSSRTGVGSPEVRKIFLDRARAEEFVMEKIRGDEGAYNYWDIKENFIEDHDYFFPDKTEY